MKKLIATTALLVLVPMLASAQSTGQQFRGQGYFFVGGALSSSSTGLGSSGNSLQFGGGGEWLIGHGIGLGGEYLSSKQSFEGFSRDDTRIGSINVSYHFGPSMERRKVEPFVTGGYTFFYAPGTSLGHNNGGNFGGGVNLWLSRHAALRLEIRDDIGGQDLSAIFIPEGTYYMRSSQHLVGFRVGVTFR